MLKPQYFGYLIQRANSLEKTLMPGMIKGKRKKWRDKERDGEIALPTQYTLIRANSRRELKTGKPSMLQSMGSQRVIHD